MAASEAEGSFVPSRDLPSLKLTNGVEAVRSGLRLVALSLGVAEHQSEVICISGRAEGSSRLAEEDVEADGQAFEERFVRRWVTGVARADWALGSSANEDNVQACIDEASRLISVLSGQAASGTISRTYKLETGETVVVADTASIEGSLGGRTWGAAPILANEIGLRLANGAEKRSDGAKCALELGAGTGLAGLALAAACRSQGRKLELGLTDYDDAVLANLRQNVQLNGTKETLDISVKKLDWSDSKCEGLWQHADALIAADCIYEPDHALLIRQVSERLLSGRKRNDPQGLLGELLLMMPLRETHAAETASVLEQFTPQSHKDACSRNSGRRLCITSWQDFAGRDDFGPPKLRYSDVSKPGSGDMSAFRDVKPRIRHLTYHRGVEHSCQNKMPTATSDLLDEIEGQQGATAYRLYTMQWKA